MTGTQLASLIRYKTKTNSTTFTDAEMLPLVKIFIDEIASLITQKNQMYFAIPTKDNLVANQREYAIGDDMLNSLIKVECMFVDGDSYIPLIALKGYEGSETESEIVREYANSEGECFYYIRRRAIQILSGTISAVTNGLRYWYLTYPAYPSLSGSTDMSVDPSTTTHGFPKQFHELLARRVSIEYKNSQTKLIPLNDMEKNYFNDLEKQLIAIGRINLDIEETAELPTSSELYDNGFDL